MNTSPYNSQEKIDKEFVTGSEDKGWAERVASHNPKNKTEICDSCPWQPQAFSSLPHIVYSPWHANLPTWDSTAKFISVDPVHCLHGRMNRMPFSLAFASWRVRVKPKLFSTQIWKGERKGKSIILSLIKLRVFAHVQGTIPLTTLARIWHGDMSLATILCPPAALGITQEI